LSFDVFGPADFLRVGSQRKPYELSNRASISRSSSVSAAANMNRAAKCRRLDDIGNCAGLCVARSSVPWNPAGFFGVFNRRFESYEDMPQRASLRSPNGTSLSPFRVVLREPGHGPRLGQAGGVLG